MTLLKTLEKKVITYKCNLIGRIKMLKRSLLLYVNIAGVAVYLYTIYYAFSAAGLLAAILSACLPVLANIYWMYSITMDTGNWMNTFQQQAFGQAKDQVMIKLN